jgi:hypothetical protein
MIDSQTNSPLEVHTVKERHEMSKTNWKFGTLQNLGIPESFNVLESLEVRDFSSSCPEFIFEPPLRENLKQLVSICHSFFIYFCMDDVG